MKLKWGRKDTCMMQHLKCQALAGCGDNTSYSMHDAVNKTKQKVKHN